MRKIVALNSTPDSIFTAHFAIESLLNQLEDEDIIVLYLSRKTFSNIELPGSIKKLLSKRFRVDYIDEDLGRHNSYYYAIKDYPEDIIIIGNDNIEYPENAIDLLVSGHKDFPNEMVCLSGKTIAMNNENEFLSFAEWKDEIKIIGIPSFAVYANIGAGVLIPPHSLCEMTVSVKEIRDFSLEKMELWLNLMAIASGTRKVLLNKKWKSKKVDIETTRTFWETVEKKSNDEVWEITIKKIEDAGKIIRKTIFADYINCVLPEYRKIRNNLKKEKAKNINLKRTRTWKAGKLIACVPQKIRNAVKYNKKNTIDDAMYNAISDILKENGYKLDNSKEKYLKIVNNK